MLASQNPEAMMPPALMTDVAIIHRPYSEAPSLRSTIGATSSIPNGYEA
jgi:hypothetical protein